MASLMDRLSHAWNAFTNPEQTRYLPTEVTSSFRPDRVRLSGGNERSIITAIYNRLALDCSAISILHCKVDDNGHYTAPVDNSKLNERLTTSANLDQTGRAFIHDVVISLLDEGCVAIVPTDTNIDPRTGSFSIDELRVGKITEWMPKYVRVRVYNEKTGSKQEITLPKSTVAIVENPFYSVMNEKNSVLQRLIRKLNLLDVIDEQSGQSKLDLLIQLPYSIRGESRIEQAEERKKTIEMQLANSQYGIAYIDSTEHVTQLNRSLENNLMTSIEYLTRMLYGQLGITEEILNGSAEEAVMANYYTRTIEPIVSAIVDEMKRKFLTQTARTQKQSIVYFRDPFKLVPVSSLADIADKFTRNEIMSSNEIRQIVGMKPVDDPKANELRNSNINAGNEQKFPSTNETDSSESTKEAEIQNGKEKV